MRNGRTTIGMVGLGYVGLTTAACFISRGVKVVGVDVDRRRIAMLSKGEVPIHEDGVEPLVRKGLANGLASFDHGFDSLDECGVIFLTVGTPGLPDGAIDTRYVEAAAGEVGARLKAHRAYPVVVVKSTVTPGTTVAKVLPILEERSGLRCGAGFGLATNPEFLREGKALWDMRHPDAVVIGRVDGRSVGILRRLYKEVYGELPPFLVMDAANSEFVKYGVNSLRAAQLSFINTVANMCARVEGAQIEEVMKGVVRVARIDSRYSRAGLGFAGSCLPKDTKALAAFAHSLGVDGSLLEAAIRVNEAQATEAIAMARDLVGPLEGKRVAVLGLTFKAGTDDVRESVGLRLVDRLAESGAAVVAYDPGFGPERAQGGGFTLAKSLEECLRGADCCVVTNEWPEFKSLPPSAFKRLMKRPAVVDGRGLYDVAEFAKSKVPLRRVGVGARPPASPTGP